MLLRSLGFQMKLAEEGIDPYAATAGVAAGAVPASAMYFNRSPVQAKQMGLSVAEAMQQALPGDVFVTSGKGEGVRLKDIGSAILNRNVSDDLMNRVEQTAFKNVGAPGAYHAGMIGENTVGHHVGDKLPQTWSKDKFIRELPSGEDITILRPKDRESVKALRSHLNSQTSALPESVRKSKAYSLPRTALAGLADTLIPAPMQEWIGNRLGKNVKCRGDFCSTLVSAGTGKTYGAMTPNMVMPRHLLASKDFEQVASTVTKDAPKSTARLKTLGRVGAGLGLGYGVYRGVKGLRNYFGGDDE